jgi:hypothetical protein
MIDTSMNSGAYPNSMRKATSAWLALLATALLIAPHATEFQAAAGAAPPEPQNTPQSTTVSPGAPTPEGPKYALAGRRSVLVAGGDYADLPGRAGNDLAPRTWMCPDAALLFGPEFAAGYPLGISRPYMQSAHVSERLNRGPPA